MGIGFGKVKTVTQVSEDTKEIVTDGYYNGQLNTRVIEYEVQVKTSQAQLLKDVIDGLAMLKTVDRVEICVTNDRFGHPAMLIKKYPAVKDDFQKRHK